MMKVEDMAFSYRRNEYLLTKLTLKLLPEVYMASWVRTVAASLHCST